MAKKRKAAKKTAKKTSAAARKASGPMMAARRNVSVASNSREPAKARVAALAQSAQAVCGSDQSLQAVLKVLRDQDEKIEVRLAALQSVQAASFSAINFESCRPDYIAALREVATDPHEELRHRALGILAREKDGFAQKKLLEGLKKPEKALVPPEKALQLLAYDAHAEAYSIAREYVSKAPNPTAKREAIRLLASDATAAPMLEKVLRDKSESADIRRTSAAALNVVKPDSLKAYAREALMDESEPDELQATSLTALSQFSQSDDIADDEGLMKRVENLRDAAPPAVKQTARRLLKKYGR